jgi:ParB family chromosome partitioning protein
MTELRTIPLDQIVIDPANARMIEADDDVSGLAASIAAVGLLQPIVVRPICDDGQDGYFLLAGKRRVAALRSLGRTHVAALEYFPVDDGEGYARAASAAENMARKAMHPVDQWRAMADLVEQGAYTVDGAADALGIDRRLGQRLSWLGHMAPKVLEALGHEKELPQPRELRLIALAPHDVQEKALEQAQASRGKREVMDWWQVAGRCQKTRISRKVAIFDIEASNIAFDEDLFAEPGSAEQFTTADLMGFLTAQQLALEARIEASKGRLLLGEADQHGTIIPPKGYVASYDPVPKRFRKDDPRKVAVGVVQSGYRIGEVSERLMIPAPEKAAAQATRQDAGEAVQPARQREPVTKSVQAHLAALKGQAVHEAAARRAAAWAETDNWPDIVRMLLLCFTANNVSVNTASVDYGHHRMSVLASRLLTPQGAIRELTPAELAGLVAMVVEHVIRFDHPNTNFGTSGDTAEWIGSLVDAEDRMPRCDTEEILRGFTGEKLAEIAQAQGIDPGGKVGDLRKRLIGHMPDWRPVTFGVAVEEPDTLDDEPDEVEP